MAYKLPRAAAVSVAGISALLVAYCVNFVSPVSFSATAVIASVGLTRTPDTSPVEVNSSDAATGVGLLQQWTQGLQAPAMATAVSQELNLGLSAAELQHHIRATPDVQHLAVRLNVEDWNPNRAQTVAVERQPAKDGPKRSYVPTVLTAIANGGTEAAS